MKIQEIEIQLSNNSKFKIYHNLPDQINNALENWIVRTSDYTAQSFCDYINDKRIRGLTDHFACTEERWQQMQQEINQEQKQ